MDFKELVRTNRSCRRFAEASRIDIDTLRDIVEHARYAASGFNRQPLKYVLAADPASNGRIFATLTWGGSVENWPQPREGERPAAYIVILTDTRIRPGADIDVGVAAQTLLLAATAAGLAGCMLRGVDRAALRRALALPDHLAISLVVGLGRPAETRRVVDARPGEPLAFYRAADGGHVVPKRTLDELIHAILDAGSPPPRESGEQTSGGT